MPPRTSMEMSAPAMNESGLPEMRTAALIDGSVSSRVITLSNVFISAAESVFTFSPGASKRTTAIPSAVTFRVTGSAAAGAVLNTRTCATCEDKTEDNEARARATWRETDNIAKEWGA